MICTNCFEAEYTTAKTDLAVTINGQKHVLRDLDCETCPACGDITFTHAQSLEVDKKRIALEFGVKPLLTPAQLKTLRRVLNMKLEEICDLLHVGRNTYGRWERGEVEITPSMNLLVHNLIEKVPDARVNLLEGDRIAAIEKANARLLGQYISFGEYIREVVATTRLLPDVVCTTVGIEPAELARIQNNDVEPERTLAEVTAKLAHFFRINFDALKKLLNEAAKVIAMKGSVRAVHARSTCYDAKGAAVQASSVNKIMEKLAQKKGGGQGQGQVSEEYLAKVKAILERLNEGGGVGP
jgi:putative zinc finger/helix-turn-helix YgiT family protein